MRILSGIQPTGSIHIGNYLGAIKHWVSLQEKADCIFFIADLHSLTIPYNSSALQKNILDAAIAHLAVGIDPSKSILFVQSQVKEHTELCWLLTTITPIGDLQRMTQYKEKAKQFRKDINAGLLNYPILQAADILLYQADLVPVGKDQLQHIEFARTIARRFNSRFGKTFKEPTGQIPKVGARVMSLNNPKQKMSKSLGPQSYISLFENQEEIQNKIMAAVTDTGKNIKYDPERKPGISNLITIFSLFSEKSIKEIGEVFQNKGYAEFKKSLAKLLIDSLEPFRKKKKELDQREVYVKEILTQGAKRAQIIATSTIAGVRKKMGLV